MPRKHHYYDPIVQRPDAVPLEENRERVEVYPDEGGVWHARRVDRDGRLVGEPFSNVNHDGLIAQVQIRYPGLPVYELRDETEDSTWTGMGPSPRLWQGSSPGDAGEASREPPPTGPFPEGAGTPDGPGDDELPPEGDPVEIRGFTVEAGTYLHVDDVRRWLNDWASAYDEQNNPSASQALRGAADSLQQGGSDG